MDEGNFPRTTKSFLPWMIIALSEKSIGLTVIKIKFIDLDLSLLAISSSTQVILVRAFYLPTTIEKNAYSFPLPI